MPTSLRRISLKPKVQKYLKLIIKMLPPFLPSIVINHFKKEVCTESQVAAIAPLQNTLQESYR